MLPSCASIFKCGWCGAITDHNKKKCDEKCVGWRLLRDRCFLSVVLVFMFFVICKSLLYLLFLLLFVVMLLYQNCFYFHLGLGLISSSSRFLFNFSSFLDWICTFKLGVDGWKSSFGNSSLDDFRYVYMFESKGFRSYANWKEISTNIIQKGNGTWERHIS